MGRDPDPEKFRADEHPEASTAVSNRTAAMPDRHLAASMTSQDVNWIHHAQIVARWADCELVQRRDQTAGRS